MKVHHPITGKIQWFFDKCLAFGASILCALFNSFSESLRHFIEHRLGMIGCTTNYLDDFIFLAESEELCNHMVRTFLDLCQQIGCPVSADKTEWATQKIIFLGIVLNGRNLTLSVPEDKRIKAVNLLKWVINKKKITILTVQRLTGILNFLAKAVVPGQAFIQRMYDSLTVTDKNRHLEYHDHF